MMNIIQWMPLFFTVLLIFVLIVLLIRAVLNVLAKPPAIKRSVKPRITIIIDISNGSSGMQLCTESIRALKYKKLDVVLASNGRSIPAANALAKTYSNVYFYRARTKRGEAEFNAQAYKRSKKGELVIVLGSPIMFNRTLLALIIERQSEVSMGDTIAINRVSQPAGFTGTINNIQESTRRFIHAVRSIVPSRKATLSPNDYVTSNKDIARIPTTQRNSVPIYIASTDSLEYKLAVPHQPMLAAAAIIAIILFITMTIFAIDGTGLEAFVYSWLLVSALFSVVILFDEYILMRSKISTVFYVSFMPVMVILSCFFTVQRKKLTL